MENSAAGGLLCYVPAVEHVGGFRSVTVSTPAEGTQASDATSRADDAAGIESRNADERRGRTRLTRRTTALR
jgi:hypothetical protein